MYLDLYRFTRVILADTSCLQFLESSAVKNKATIQKRRNLWFSVKKRN